MKQKLSDVKQSLKKMQDKTVMTTHAIKTGLMKKSYCLKTIAPFCYQELHNKQIISEKRLDSISSNSNKVKIVKYLSENQKQEVQHEKKKQ